MVDLHHECENLIHLTRHYDDILEKKAENYKNKDWTQMYTIVEEEFHSLQDLLKSLNRAHETFPSASAFMEAHLKQSSWIKRRTFNTQVNKVFNFFIDNYKVYFKMYNDLRHQLSSLQQNKPELFSKYYKEQLTILGKLQSGQDATSKVYSSIRSLTKGFKKHSLIPYTFFPQASPILKLAMLILIIFSLNSAKTFAQESKLNKDYFKSMFEYVITHEKPNIEYKNQNDYVKIFDNGVIYINDFRKDTVLNTQRDDLSFKLEDYSDFKEFLHTKGSFLNLTTNNGKIFVMEFTTVNPHNKHFKKIKTGDYLPSGHFHIQRTKMDEWVRLLSKEEIEKVGKILYLKVIK